MIWCVIGLLFLNGDHSAVRVCDYRTWGDCVEAKKQIYRVAFSHPKSGAMLICKEEVPNT